MRITSVSWVLVVAGGPLFGAALMVVARVLPSSATPAAVAIVDRGQAIVLTPAADGDTGSGPHAHGAEAAVPGMTGDDVSTGIRVFDLRITDPALRDRNGNAPRRALTPDELRAVATAYDVVADDMAGQPDGTSLSAEDIAVLRDAHPGIRVVRVLETLTSNDPAWPGVRPDDGTHSPWFLDDGAGQPALVRGRAAAWNGEPNFVMDPSNDGVRLAVAARARQYMMLGYDGVWLAGVSSARPALVSGEAHHGGRAYAEDEWRDAVAGLIHAVSQLAPSAVMYVDGPDVAPAFAEANGVIATSR